MFLKLRNRFAKIYSDASVSNSYHATIFLTSPHETKTLDPLVTKSKALSIADMVSRFYNFPLLAHLKQLQYAHIPICLRTLLALSGILLLII